MQSDYHSVAVGNRDKAGRVKALALELSSKV